MALPSIDPSAFGAPPDVLSQQFNMPQPQPSGGMFGGGSNLQNALMAASAGFLARTRPGLAQSMMEGMQQRQALSHQAQLATLRDNLEFSRQMQMAQLGAKLKLEYPDSPLAQALYQGGTMPGSPEWIKAMQTQATNLQDPVVNAGLYGPVLRSQVSGAVSAKPLTDADIAHLENGGQTAAPSGGFLGAGSYPDAGPYHRY